MKSLSARIALPLLGLAALGIAALTVAGPLNPPAGPVASSGRSLDEIYNAVQALQGQKGTPITALPFTISAPGSYYLPQNLTIANNDGITISADNVTLDLNGFSLIGGYTGTAGTRRGIIVTQNGSNNRRNITIRNGTVREFTSNGIDATFVSSGLFENLNLYNNGRSGLITGEGCIIERCTAYLNHETGIACGTSNTVENCTAQLNGARPNTAATNGFIISSGSVVRGCVATLNFGQGFSVGSQCVISRCQATSNDVSGFVAVNDCILEYNNSSYNGGNVANGGGITITGNANRLDSNNCTGNDRNFDIAAGFAAGGNFLTRNSASRPTGGTTANNFVIGINNHYGQILTFPGSGFQDSASFANIIY